jgi:hypothetical protein
MVCAVVVVPLRFVFTLKKHLQRWRHDPIDESTGMKEKKMKKNGDME